MRHQPKRAIAARHQSVCFVPRAVVLSLMGALAVGQAQAQENNDRVFQLGKVVVQSNLDREAPLGESAVSQKEMQAFDLRDVGAAVSVQPGVTVSAGGARNEQMVYVRGFDSRQVPLFLDGIPQYVPYDGYVDFTRFTTMDLSEIRVAKGAASLLYGPNIMGGAINLVTRKPVKEFEGEFRAGYATGDQRYSALNVGTNQGSWYLQAGLSWSGERTFPLGRGFEDQKARPTDTGGMRSNASQMDKKASFKLGITPNATDEYVIAYVNQKGQKDNPVYTGVNDAKLGQRYWRWPYWDKESLYFLSSTQIGESNTIKTRVYEDKYKNGLDMYSDGQYATLTGPTSEYTDRTRGAALEWVNTSLDNHELHFALHYKEDQHRDPKSSGTEHYKDVTTSLAFEDRIALGELWQLRVGASHERRKAKEAHNFETGDTDATNGLLELGYDWSEAMQVYGSVAYKTRFPTIKDRYSSRMGYAQPNPDLKPEHAIHYELGLRGQPWEGAQLESALFLSQVRDMIQSTVIQAPGCDKYRPVGFCDQATNVGKARQMGLELSLQQEFSAHWSAGLAYTYLNRRNQSDPDVKLVDTPNHRLFAHLSWKPTAQWEVMGSVETESGRYYSYANNKGDQIYEKTPGFALLGLKGIWRPNSDITLEAGVRNLGDKLYQYKEGYPMPGRVWFVGGSYRF